MRVSACFKNGSIVAALCTVALVCGLAGTAFSATRTVTVTGTSSLSYADAQRQAIREAVESAVGVFIQSETEMENYQINKDAVLTHSEGYIKSYEVLEKRQDSLFHVTLRAAVSEEQLKNDLIAMKILLENLDRPKLMLLVKETCQECGAPTAYAESSLVSQFAQKGFDLVDQYQLKQVVDTDSARLALSGDPAAASSLAQRFGAQYVVVGDCLAQSAGEAFEGSGLQSMQATLSLKVIQSQTARILGGVSQHAAAAHISALTGAQQAVTKASEKSYADIENVIMTAFQDYLNNGLPLKLYARGVGSFAMYKDVTAYIEAMPRAASVKKEGWDKNSGLLIFDLTFRGTSEELAMELDGVESRGHSFEVVDFAPDKVDITVK